MYLPWPSPNENWPAESGDRPEPDSADLHIEALVAQRLSIDWTTRRQQISVRVQNRVVILSGLVSATDVRQGAGELAWDVPGVVDVCNMLRPRDQRRGHR